MKQLFSPLFSIAWVLLLIQGCSLQNDQQVSDDLDKKPLAAAADYLTPAVRQEVEKLKLTAGQATSDPEEIEHRIDVLWAWANGMARRDGGLKIAPNLTALVAQMKGSLSGYNLLVNPDARQDQDLIQQALSNKKAMSVGLALFNGYVEELSLREFTPDVFGVLTTDTPGPFRAGTYQTIRQTWTLGSRNLEAGGYLMVAQHFMANQGVYQVSDPKADHYVTITSSNDSVTFKPITMAKTGQHGGFRAARPNLAFQVQTGVLISGDVVTITYGDRSGGSRGFKVQSVSNDSYQLPVYVSFDDTPINFMLDLTAFTIVGNEASGVQGFVPSIVAVGEPFTLSVRSEDSTFNRATGAISGYQLTLNGKDFKRLPPGRQAITLVEDIRLEAEGVYRFGIRSLDGKIEGQSNPIQVQKDPKIRIYWGDTHGHSGFAEGQGSPEAYFRFGRDDSRLDFLTLSEHDIWLDDGEWQHMIRTVKDFNREGEFIAYLGYEYTMPHARGGHHNVLFLSPDNRERVNAQYFPVLTMLYEGLRARNDPAEVLIIPHAHQAGYWKLNDADMETLVEIQSQHGYFEWFGQRYLNQGYHTGFIAASDDHLGHPGYTSISPRGFVYQGGLAGVRANERTSVAIFKALKSRQTYATTVDRMILEFDVNGVDMGGFAVVAGKTKIAGQVMGTAAIDSITIVRNGEDIWHKDYRQTSRIDPQETILELAFNSESHSKGYQVDNPRGARLWYGSAVVEGAEVVAVDAGYKNALLPPTWIETAHKVHFALRTRGETRRLRLHLKGADSTSRIHIHLDGNRESPTAPAATRRPVMLEAEDFQFNLADVVSGKAIKLFKVDEYNDRVMPRLLSPEVIMDRSFSYVDEAKVRPGDYYFVRVEQSNSGIAWASPVWMTK